MHRLYNWYNAVEACAKTWHLQIWYYPFCILTKLYIHIVCDYMSYRAIAYHIISFQTMILKESSTISILPSCAYDVCHNFHVPGWSDRKRLGRLGQLHSISFARIREWTRRAGARGFLGSRRLYRRRKRRGLQATSRHRDQAWSHFDVGHHGIHHPSGLDLLKLCFKSFKTISVKIIKVCFFVNGHFYNSTIVGWTYWQCVFSWMHPDETIPRRSLANSLATYLHPPVWSSPTCLMVWLPSQRSQPQDRVETNGSIWKSKPYLEYF